MRVLVIAAHPDDEILGCGGTMAKLSKKGDEVYVAILGEGATSRTETREGTDAGEISKLRKQADEAVKAVGAKELFTFGLPDNRFDSIPLLDVIKPIEGLISKLKPNMVFTHHGGDLNIDHRITYQAVLTATRPMESCSVKEVLAFEIASSTEWAFQRLSPEFKANVFFDISDTIDHKIAGMKAYASEMRPFPHPRSEEALRAIATRWGSVVGCKAAESFELIRSFRS